jgi:hypothetical protein
MKCRTKKSRILQPIGAWRDETRFIWASLSKNRSRPSSCQARLPHVMSKFKSDGRMDARGEAWLPLVEKTAYTIDVRCWNRDQLFSSDTIRIEPGASQHFQRPPRRTTGRGVLLIIKCSQLLANSCLLFPGATCAIRLRALAQIKQKTLPTNKPMFVPS